MLRMKKTAFEPQNYSNVNLKIQFSVHFTKTLYLYSKIAVEIEKQKVFNTVFHITYEKSVFQPQNHKNE